MSDAKDNLWSLLAPALQKHRRRPAWICRGRDARRVVTYAEIYNAALTTAGDLRARGVDAGDTVGVTAPNGPEFTVAALAAWKVGAALAPIHTGNSDFETARQLEALSPTVLLKHESAVEYAGAVDIDMTADADAITAEADRRADFNADHLAARLYTSGSTGTPKVVRLSHGNLASNVRAAARIETFTARDRFISLLPFSHAMGLMGNLLLPLTHGAAIVTPSKLAAAEILETLSEEKISVVIAVPRLYRNVMLGLEKKFRDGGVALRAYRSLLKAAPLPLRRRINAPLRKKLGGDITAWVSGGSHLDGRIVRYYYDLGLPLRQGYGLTETSPLTCIQRNFDDATDSVGMPIEKVRVKIHDADAGGNGEVWIAGPNVMLGYEDAQQNREAMHDRWFKSGDIGRLDERGRLFLTGRSKRLIVTEAGKNVYPEELETLLERDPAVKEAGVLEADARPVCVLAMHELDAAAARSAIKKFNELVSAHNRITRFALVDELPRTPLGKVALKALPEIFAQHEAK